NSIRAATLSGPVSGADDAAVQKRVRQIQPFIERPVEWPQPAVPVAADERGGIRRLALRFRNVAATAFAPPHRRELSDARQPRRGVEPADGPRVGASLHGARARRIDAGRIGDGRTDLEFRETGAHAL